ncbi:FAD-dependent cmnm(5)s(2)U34 oxidoreductase [hydrothermal vent metagenome]|uniref:FAD-dependent cmnm(5)s(2)U34 oxidoreductase n=1 Tax=hydrothermal vent metagenome TaxID=652676 RepID=A0A3B0TCU9_9ZZZZ
MHYFCGMLDYLVVGLGLAGTSFCEQLEKNGKSYQVISDESQISSKVAGGLFNPVILKRFTLAWLAKEQLEIAIPFYTRIEERLDVKLISKIPVLRRFASIEEQNLWFEASDKPQLKPFLSLEIHQNKNPYIDAPFGYGEVFHTGRIDTEKLLSGYKAYLLQKDMLWQEHFDFSCFKVGGDSVTYKSIKAQQIIFAEGFGLKQNPYFNYLPLVGTKGEYITIKAPGLKEKNSIKSSIFCIPLGNDTYKIGANYERKDKTNDPTEKAKTEILKKLDALITCDYKVIDHVAGVRPTVVDRRPLVGRHPEHENLYVLNGFGSRGFLIAPYVSEQLFELVETQKSLPREVGISRFTKKWFK